MKENNQNLIKARRNNQTGFLGVSPKRGKFDAKIVGNRKHKLATYLQRGSFISSALFS